MTEETAIGKDDVSRMLRTIYSDVMNWLFIGVGIMVWFVSGELLLGVAVTALTCLPYNESVGNYDFE